MENTYRSTTQEFDNLLLMGQLSTVTDIVSVAAGQTLKRGTVIGLTADTKEAYPVDVSKNDGRQQPYAILADDVKTEDDPGTAAAYLMGEFNADSLTVGSGKISDYKYEMRKIGLIVRYAQDRRFDDEF